MKEVAVRYISLPSIERGIAGFYAHYKDKGCVQPNKAYANGRCHTIGDEMDVLAKKVGFITRLEYKATSKRWKMSSWKNAYGSALSQAVGEALQNKGVILNINDEKVLFWCPKGEFVEWPGAKYKVY